MIYTMKKNGSCRKKLYMYIQKYIFNVKGKIRDKYHYTQPSKFKICLHNNVYSSCVSGTVIDFIQSRRGRKWRWIQVRPED